MGRLVFGRDSGGTPVEKVTNGVPVIDTNHGQIHAGAAFSLIGTITIVNAKVGGIQIYVPGEDYATKTFDMTNANADLTYTAVDYGTPGNNISVTHVDPAGNDKALAVSVSGTDITVSLATGGAGAITSTAAQVKAAVNAHAAASLLVTCEDEGAGGGVVNALAKASLAGGAYPAYVHLQAAEFTSASGPASISVLEDYWMSDASGASTLVPANHHRIKRDASVLTVLAKADITAATGAGEAAGTTLAVVPLHGSGVGANKIAASVSNSQERILWPGKKYLIAISNSASGGVLFGYNLFWYEESGA